MFFFYIISAVNADEIDEVRTVVHGIILGMETPFPLPNPDACVDSGLSCPLKKGNSYAYVASLPVKRAYPKVSGLIDLPVARMNLHCHTIIFFRCALMSSGNFRTVQMSQLYASLFQPKSNEPMTQR